MNILDPAQVYLFHVAKAAQKLAAREFAHKKLALELAALRRISTPSLHKHLKKLERSIQDAIVTEKKILSNQGHEDTIHSRLGSRVHEVSRALDEYVRLSKHQSGRTAELTKDLSVSDHARKSALMDIERALSRLERMYRVELQAMQAHKHRQLLHAIKRKVSSLQERSQHSISRD
ncbi:hypothetical protein HY490_04335 [Candidatus Woesearchaeota archaeon]|nr:hypothetical protein [Candidatus Woesearchaeota archaeon]